MKQRQDHIRMIPGTPGVPGFAVTIDPGVMINAYDGGMLIHAIETHRHVLESAAQGDGSSMTFEAFASGIEEGSKSPASKVDLALISLLRRIHAEDAEAQEILKSLPFNAALIHKHPNARDAALAIRDAIYDRMGPESETAATMKEAVLQRAVFRLVVESGAEFTPKLNDLSGLIRNEEDSSEMNTLQSLGPALTSVCGLAFDFIVANGNRTIGDEHIHGLWSATQELVSEQGDASDSPLVRAINALLATSPAGEAPPRQMDIEDLREALKGVAGTAPAITVSDLCGAMQNVVEDLHEGEPDLVATQGMGRLLASAEQEGLAVPEDIKLAIRNAVAGEKDGMVTDAMGAELYACVLRHDDVAHEDLASPDRPHCR